MLSTPFRFGQFFAVVLCCFIRHQSHFSTFHWPSIRSYNFRSVFFLPFFLNTSKFLRSGFLHASFMRLHDSNKNITLFEIQNGLLLFFLAIFVYAFYIPKVLRSFFGLSSPIHTKSSTISNHFSPLKDANHQYTHK